MSLILFRSWTFSSEKKKKINKKLINNSTTEWEKSIFIGQNVRQAEHKRQLKDPKIYFFTESQNHVSFFLGHVVYC